MKFKTSIPEWGNEGVEPPEELKRDGFVAGYKPPAPFFNWFFHGLRAAVKENRDSLAALDSELVPISDEEIDSVTG